MPSLLENDLARRGLAEIGGDGRVDAGRLGEPARRSGDRQDSGAARSSLALMAKALGELGIVRWEKPCRTASNR